MSQYLKISPIVYGFRLFGAAAGGVGWGARFGIRINFGNALVAGGTDKTEFGKFGGKVFSAR
jgi:hypothetical protein